MITFSVEFFPIELTSEFYLRVYEVHVRNVR